MNRRTVRGDGVDLAVFEAGPAGAPTIVLVHGYPDTHAVWSGVAERLAERHHVVAYDVRGAGASGAPQGKHGFKLERLAADLRAVVDAVSPDRPVHLVGHDWGAIQAWEPVTDGAMQRRFASFTAIAGPCLDHVGAWLRQRVSARPSALRALGDQALRSWYILAFHVPGLAPLLWRAGLARAFPVLLERVEGVSATANGASDTLVDDGVRGIGLYRDNIRERLLHPRERRTDVPVQIVTLDGDHFVGEGMFDGVERWVPRLWRRHARGGHWILRSEPDRVARFVDELVQHVEGGALPPGLRRSGRKVVLVTGAGSGIGRKTALAFAEQGAVVLAVDIDGKAAERTAELCRLLGAEARPFRVDVGDTRAMESLASTVAQDYEAPDVVVNNAGIGLAGPVLATGVADWERVLKVNLWGVIHGSRLFGAQMVRRGEGGHIVNVSSATAFAPSRALPAYATSKAAVLMLTECLRAELAEHGIGVSAICPGIIDTPIATSAKHVGVDEAEQRRRSERAGKLYRRRAYPPDKVAQAVLAAVEKDLAVVPVSPEAYAVQAMGRFLPRLSRRLARVDLATR